MKWKYQKWEKMKFLEAPAGDPPDIFLFTFTRETQISCAVFGPTGRALIPVQIQTFVRYTRPKSFSLVHAKSATIDAVVRVYDHQFNKTQSGRCEGTDRERSRRRGHCRRWPRRASVRRWWSKPPAAARACSKEMTAVPDAGRFRPIPCSWIPDRWIPDRPSTGCLSVLPTATTHSLCVAQLIHPNDNKPHTCVHLLIIIEREIKGQLHSHRTPRRLFVSLLFSQVNKATFLQPNKQGR